MSKTQSEYFVRITQIVKGTSETLQRIFKFHGVLIFHKPFNSLRNQLTLIKDLSEKIEEVRGRLPNPMWTMPGKLHWRHRQVSLYPDQRTPTRDTFAVFEDQLPGNGSRHLRAQCKRTRYYLTKTTPSSTDSRRPLLLNKGNPPWIRMRAWTYHQFTILSWRFVTFLSHNFSTHYAYEVWVIRTKFFALSFGIFLY